MGILLEKDKFERGGRSRFKARSGSLLLNVERSRRPCRDAKRKCESCEGV